MEVNFGKPNLNALQERYRKSLSDPDFKTLASHLGVADEELMKHTSKLEDAVKELKRCKNCKGLYECQNRVKGTVFYPEVRNGKVYFSYVACKYQNQYLNAIAHSCEFLAMPEALRIVRMRDIRTDDALRIDIIKWLKGFYDTFLENPHQKGLYLHGSFGSGKTFLICAMLNELALKDVNIVACYYPELLRSLKSSFDEDFGPKIEKIKTAEILFLDDIGAESVTTWSRDEILGTILQYRMDEKLPTFFTSNLTIEELESHLSVTKTGVEIVKARRIIERIKFLTDDFSLISKNRRNEP